MQLICIFCTFVGMEEILLKEILHDYQLRVTPGRCDVIDQFLQSNYALSAKDLESRLPQYDRVTLYRTLHTFIEKGILHLIPHDGGLAYFGLSESIRPQLDTAAQTSSDTYYSDHIHFTCIACGRTECLSDYMIPTVNLPQGYQAEEVDLLVKGKCQACQV